MAYELGAWGQAMQQDHVDTSSQANMARSLFWNLIAFLTGQIGPGGTGVWTVIKSSAYIDYSWSVTNTNQYAGAYDASKIVRATAGVEHSWIVLQAPVSLGSVQLVIDLSATVDILMFASPKFSKAGFTVGGTDALNRPTAADEVSVVGPSGFCVGPTTTVQRWSGILSPRGDFWFVNTYAGGGQCTFLLHCFQLMDTHPTDQWPWVFGGSTSSETAKTTLMQAPASWHFRSGGGTLAGGQSGLIIPNCGGYPMFDTHPASGDLLSHKWPMDEAWIGSRDLNLSVRKGRLADCYTGYCMDGDSGAQSPDPAEYTLWGGLWLPMTIAPLM